MEEDPCLVVVLAHRDGPGALFASIYSWLELQHWARLRFVLVVGETGPVPNDLTDIVSLVHFDKSNGWSSGDGNLRRQAGLNEALSLQADAILFTEPKIRALQASVIRLAHWLKYEMDETPVFAGYYTRDKAERGLLPRFAQHGFPRKAPAPSRTALPQTVRDDGRCKNCPDTGALALSHQAARALNEKGGFPDEFTISLEGSKTVQRLLAAGYRIHCDDDFFVQCKSPSELAAFCRDWLQSGWAAARFQEGTCVSKLGARRVAQARLTIFLLGLLAVGLTIYPVRTMAVSTLLVLLVGIVSFWRYRRPIALLFGIPFLLAAVSYAMGFLLFKIRRGKIGEVESRLFVT